MGESGYERVHSPVLNYSNIFLMFAVLCTIWFPCPSLRSPSDHFLRCHYMIFFHSIICLFGAYFIRPNFQPYLQCYLYNKNLVHYLNEDRAKVQPKLSYCMPIRIKI
ncbi:hypothetical protein Leryth_012045 [Lithospermum erythrorhizon]|nr:hypothetical protein Leryth_012045 [Lithospermum erythrorhizon]